MAKKELHIIALSKSESSKDNYVLVLEERQGFRRIPIIIGPFEAQAIAIGLENMKTNRPLTHELLLNILERQESLEEVIISDYQEKVFFAQLVLKKIDGSHELIDARCSDAIALAIRKPCPIYTTEEILQQTGIVLDNPGQSFGEKKRSLQHYSIEELEALLKQVLQKEDYESARRIQDILAHKKGE